MDMMKMWEVCLVFCFPDEEPDEYSEFFPTEVDALKYVIKCLQYSTADRIYVMSPDFVSTQYK